MRIIVAGAGGVGAYIAKVFSDKGHDVVVLEISEKAVARVEDSLDVMVLKGNAIYRKDLNRAEAAKCDLFVAMTGSDELNVLSASLAADLGAKKTVARVDSPDFYNDNKGIERGTLGITALICSSRLVSHEMVRMVREIDCKYVQNFADNSIAVGVLEITESFKHFGKSIGDLDLGKFGSVVGVVRNQEWRKAEDISKIYEGDHLVIFSESKYFGHAMARLKEDFDKKRIVLIGGGDIGGELARLIVADTKDLCVIDTNLDRCLELSQTLSNVRVVNGDGTNISLLTEQGIAKADCMISVTRADQVNLMASLLARDLGVEHSFSLVHRPGYASVYDRLGVEGSTSSHGLLALNTLWATASDHVAHVEDLEGCGHEIAEVYIDRNSISGRIKFGDINLPTSCHFLGGFSPKGVISRKDNFDLANESYLVFATPKGTSSQINKAFKRVLEKQR